MVKRFVEDTVELAALSWLEEVGYQYIGGPEIGPDGGRPERESYRDVILEERLELALVRLNPALPSPALAEA